MGQFLTALSQISTHAGQAGHGVLRSASFRLQRHGHRGLARIQSFRRTQKHEKEILEAEDLRQRSRPTSIEDMIQKTNFSRKEIQLLYRAFKDQCPDAVVTPQKFRQIFDQFYCYGDTSVYSQLIFNTMDKDHNGLITFEELIKALSILLRGSTEQKLRWIFDLYDVHKIGYVSKQNLFRVTKGIYDMMGANAMPPIVFGEIEEHVNHLFQKLDFDGDGRISLNDFITGCQNDQNIVDSLALFRYGWHNGDDDSENNRRPDNSDNVIIVNNDCTTNCDDCINGNL